MSALRSEYLRLPAGKQPEFWSPERVAHLRALAVTGRPTPSWAASPPGRRTLDRLAFPALDGATWPTDAQDVDASTTLARGRIAMRVPVYFGDMSFGSLSGGPNVALARAADATGALAGTGEGGLHPDVAACERITVQWASARFGVSPATLRRGLAVVIKVGQGAKPGVGGHLPAAKVTDVVRRTRRIPAGRDAISPAPHHDIYSIEDLGQRIAALKRLTGRPVLVKVAATHHAPFVAAGIARMGGDGVILDGAGAGTGASPTVMKEHVGIPIEFAVAGVDRMLQREGLREGFSVVAAGTVSSPLDAARLMALGADCASLGTASLVAMGCVMVHKCHLGSCPALLTTPAEDRPERAPDIDWLTRLQVNLVHGWTLELQGIVRALGLASVRDLVGRRDLLAPRGALDAASAALFGLESRTSAPLLSQEDPWNPRLHTWARELAAGKHAGEAPVSSMGSTGPLFAEEETRILDRLRIDGAQVTRPAIDSYREPVRLHVGLASRQRIAAPLLLAVPRHRPELADPVAGAAHALGLAALHPAHWPASVGRYHDRLLRPIDVPGQGRLLRVPCSERALAALPTDRRLADAVLIDEDLASGDDALPLEVMLSEADLMAGPLAPDLFVSSSTLRGAGDAFKLVALGAAGVAMPGVVERAIGEERPLHREQVEALAIGLMREMRLLLGAAGCTALPSLRGNRELLRSVNLDEATRIRVGVKPAGWG